MTKFSTIAVIDCQIAGVAGDMFLGALLDLGADANRVTQAIKSLEKPEFGYKEIQIDIQKVVRNGFSATKIDVTSQSETRKDGNKLIEIVETVSENLKLSPKAKKFASKVIHTLVETEAKLHNGNGHHLANAHLHEVGLVDTAAEIIGCAVALENLGLFDAKIVATPVSVGGGLFTFSHGTLSSPSPAALAILQSRNFPFKGGPVEAELATPTGVSILVNLASQASSFYPEMAPTKIGYGSGNKQFPQTPNLLRITVGNVANSSSLEDEIAVIETNLDDVSGEIVGYSIERLLSEGAKDVSIIPIYTKKNRPGQIIKVIADKKDAQHLSRVLIDETGTLGVRVSFCQRHIMARETHTIDLQINGEKIPITIKVSKDSEGKIIRLKPEFNDLKTISEKTNRPLRELSELALSAARNHFNLNK